MASTSTGRGNPSAPKYINDFSKALAVEVKILLEEVGKLRDEKRALQYEIAELMSIKSKHSADGAYSAGWHPPAPPPEPPAEPAPPPGPAPGGWRTVHAAHAPGKRRLLRGAPAAPTPPPAAAPTPAPAPPNLPAWAQWRPSPNLTPPTAGPSVAVVAPPPRSGLFGPKTPPPK
ncbi:hypothetical protein C8J57DRAFT_1471486 [Mycena rebaudengoi]|nr:hypothetical protein C8J57DRAFT_1453040 [Mycena rebaudengoi]KAJ7261009.1 hypothetical protein C8J57DRAFT_1471486 [Mycena rebaudengoi]